jgi:hypothetical protein
MTVDLRPARPDRTRRWSFVAQGPGPTRDHELFVWCLNLAGQGRNLSQQLIGATTDRSP